MTGPELAAIRKRLGLTQAEAAPLLGYRGSAGAQAVSQLERSRPIPPAVALLATMYDRYGIPDDLR